MMDALVQNILSSPVLSEAVHQMTGIDLVTPDWESRLTRHGNYKQFKFKHSYTAPRVSDSRFFLTQNYSALPLVLVVQCRAPEDDCIVVQTCPILEMLARANLQTVRNHYSLPETYRFYFYNDCTIQLFDGSRLVSSSLSMLQDEPFTAVIQLHLNTRYFYFLRGKRVARIGGQINRMIVMSDTVFDTSNVDLGEFLPDE